MLVIRKLTVKSSSAEKENLCFPFILNETLCGAAAALVSVADDNSRRLLLLLCLFFFSVWTQYWRLQSEVETGSTLPQPGFHSCHHHLWGSVIHTVTGPCAFKFYISSHGMPPLQSTSVGTNCWIFMDKATWYRGWWIYCIHYFSVSFWVKKKKSKTCPIVILCIAQVFSFFFNRPLCFCSLG